MGLSVGIVGLPNAGKSTLFNALLRKQVADAAPYPFCTIEPNIGIVPVPDTRLASLARVISATEGVDPPLVPAVVEFVDIAGLVKGASQGEGLGNKFLAHIRQVHLICHVVRFFPDSGVQHVAGSVDPKRDLDIITTELILADLEMVNRQVQPRGVKDPKVQDRWRLVSKVKEGLDRGLPANQIITDPDERLLIADLQLLSMKPVILIANLSEEQLLDPKQALDNRLSTMLPVVYLSAKTESELSSMEEADQIEYLKSLGLSASGLDRLIKASYQQLGLISFLTAGVKEVRAWTILQGTLAQVAAGVIHTDFTRKFIKAEVTSCEDFVTLGGWKNCRDKGRVRQEGREYVIADGEVVEFKIGA
jgi:hypothetical protein